MFCNVSDELAAMFESSKSPEAELRPEKREEAARCKAPDEAPDSSLTCFNAGAVFPLRSFAFGVALLFCASPRFRPRGETDVGSTTAPGFRLLCESDGDSSIAAGDEIGRAHV